MKEIIEKEISEHLKVANLLYGLSDDIAKATLLCVSCLKKGGKILICGNGGSAADAQHFAAELVGKYKTNRKGLAAIALTTDTSSLTSIGNDFGFDQIFERQIEALATNIDIVIGISTSGKSRNIISALKLASKINCNIISLTGQNGGEMEKISDISLTAPSIETPRIQETHIAIIHIICHLIDQEFSPKS